MSNLSVKTADDLALSEALARFEIARDEARTVDRAELLARHPALGERLDDAERVACLTRGLREALSLASPSPAPLLEGFEVLEEIGRGGMGVVYKARQKGTEQLVALKMLHSDADDPEVVQQFREEAKAAALLRHPNRVRILLLGEHEGRPFYVMELIEGGNLAEFVKRGVSKAEAVRYVAGIAEAAHEVHESGYVHRDIKPHNVLIDARTDEALLTDFGLAIADAPGEDDSPTIAGTLPYMAPEQTLDSNRVTSAADIYSLGVTLYQLIAGKLPLSRGPAEPWYEFTERIRTEPPPSLRVARPGVSRAIDAICMKCLQKSPGDRYATAADLAVALRRYLQEVSYARHFTSLGTMFIVLGPVIGALNLAVYFLMERYLVRASVGTEVAIWAGIFAMYPVFFSAMVLAPAGKPGHEHYLSRLEFWSLWGGKMFAAVFICLAYRLAFANDPMQAIRLSYVVFAALSGMAVFAMISKIDWRLAVLLAVGCWAAGVFMVLWLDLAPLIYGGYSMVGTSLYGLYLRALGRTLA